MKVLILSVTAGEGHNATARAIRDDLKRIGVSADILDTFDYGQPFLGKLISGTCQNLSQKTKGAYRVGYRLSEKRNYETYDWITVISLMLYKKFTKYINSHHYDVILFTHPFPGMLLNDNKKRGLISQPTVGVLTDFTFHPYWESCVANDYVVVADKLLLHRAREKGYRDEQILPFGIPINPKFRDRVDRTEAREKLGLDPSKRTFLVMGGSTGYAGMEAIVKSIDAIKVSRDFQIIAVAGRNDELKDALDRYAAGTPRHKLLVTGFVDYVSLLMDASDCIISKPGGLTTSESLAKNLPMIIVDPLPGHEERNAEFLLNNGCAMEATKTAPLEECIFQLLMSDVHLDAMRKCIASIAKPNSSETLSKFLVSLVAKQKAEKAEKAEKVKRVKTLKSLKTE